MRLWYYVEESQLCSFFWGGSESVHWSANCTRSCFVCFYGVSENRDGGGGKRESGSRGRGAVVVETPGSASAGTAVVASRWQQQVDVDEILRALEMTL